MFNLNTRALLRMTAREEEELKRALPNKEEVSSFRPIKSKQIKQPAPTAQANSGFDLQQEVCLTLDQQGLEKRGNIEATHARTTTTTTTSPTPSTSEKFIEIEVNQYV